MRVLLKLTLASVLIWGKTKLHCSSFELARISDLKRRPTRLHYIDGKTDENIMNQGLKSNGQITLSSVDEENLNPFETAVTKIGMMAFIMSMCVALPLALLPTSLCYQWKLISKKQCEITSHDIGQKVSKLLLTIMPFLHLKVIPAPKEEDPEPSIWVCNHTSMLDVFILLAADQELRGRNKRPIKAVYWAGLDDNPICALLFHMSGFIPVQMADNGNGNPNEYNRSSFKSLLKATKKAMDDGFDVLILPEGQLNPWPEKGLLEVFPGAFTVAQMSRRPVRMAAIYGLHHLWHPDESIGMKVTRRDASIRAYPPFHLPSSHDTGREGERRRLESGEEFVETFRAVVGHFGATGEDLPAEELEAWLDGTAWKEKKERREE